MKKTVKLFSLLMVICMLLSSCAQSVGEVANTIVNNNKTNNNVVDNVVSNTGSTENVNAEQLSASNKNEAIPEKGTYNEGVALVKYDGEMNDNVLSQLNLVSATALYSGSTWYTVELAAGADTVETVSYLRELDCFDKVDYDYIMGTTETGDAEVTDNPNYEQQTNLNLSNIPYGWTQNGKAPGGSPDVIVAVIDTGVDYNHVDLRNNIWVNSAEIPNNGKDDDGNGYIDDIYGWNCVGDNNDPMDDNGHGTHVAGIIAAENNKQGGIGVAYNCKVMVLKAGNSSGYFNNSDIAEAIQYAYMNGASVINMSFGGAQISIAVEEALENAYSTSVLVAAAGNDYKCNNIECEKHESDNPWPMYPAALPYVIGVMSANKSGTAHSSFSNFDHYPYDSIEYEVYAVGENVGSTWPGNKYASLSGTSMAAPTVSGIAALLRSAYPDRESYPTKFIQSQIVNTGTISIDGAHTVADVQQALTKLPKPTVNLYDYYIDDNTSISSANNGNGTIDAGETIRLYISLHNRGGVAKDVNISVDANRGEGVVDPYFTFTTPTMTLSDIGTYSVRESGDKYFEIIVSEDCPNDYLVKFNVRFTYKNGLDEKDKTIYVDDGKQQARFCVSNGIYLPLVISEDTILQSNRLYLLSHNAHINKNVTLTINEGAKIVGTNRYSIVNNGRIICNGTPNQLIEIQDISVSNSTTSYAEYSYVKFSNVTVDVDVMDHCVGINSSCIGGDITNSKFVNGGASGNVEHCQFVKNTSLNIDCAPYSTVSTVSLTSSKNCIYLAPSCSVSSYIRPAITLESIGQIVRTENRAYVVLSVKFEGGHPYCNPYGLAREANYLASYFGGRLSNMSREEYLALGIYGAPLSNGSSLVVLNTSNTDQILFEVDDIDISYGKIREGYDKYCDEYMPIGNYENVAFLTGSTQIKSSYSIDLIEDKYRYNLSNIYWGTNDVNTILGMISDYELYGQYKSIQPEGYLESPVENMWPMVSNVSILNQDGENVNIIGNQTVRFVVEFNRDMDTSIPLTVTFGTVAPYADYKINGEWITPRQWVGEYTLKSSIENGKQYIMISNAQAAEDSFFTAEDKTGRFTFTIDTTAAMSMNLIANPTENGIELTFAQDDYDTLLGYNIYRADSKDGNYVKLNPAILLPTDSTFLDENAEPGKTYWYTYTVVLTDFNESNPAGKVMATAMDTLAPNMYHTPVNQGYMNNNLVISCTATDNMAIASVTLYYRTVGATEWKTLNMAKQSDKYSATIFGSDLTLDGIEYYIVASDGRNTINKGSAEAPYTVIVKDASAISRKGDVDGDGVVTTKDALMLMQCINGDLILSDDEFKRADLNGDNVLNSSEALRILQYINGNVSTLDM